MSEEVVRTFEVTETQNDKAGEWVRAHDREKHIKPGQKYRYSGAIGGAYTWQFTSTSLGVITTLACSCGDKLELTDWDTFG